MKNKDNKPAVGDTIQIKCETWLGGRSLVRGWIVTKVGNLFATCSPKIPRRADPTMRRVRLELLSPVCDGKWLY